MDEFQIFEYRKSGIIFTGRIPIFRYSINYRQQITLFLMKLSGHNTFFFHFYFSLILYLSSLSYIEFRNRLLTNLYSRRLFIYLIGYNTKFFLVFFPHGYSSLSFEVILLNYIINSVVFF